MRGLYLNLIRPKMILAAHLQAAGLFPPALFCYSEPRQRSTDMAGKSLNRVQLIGNLGKDPEVKFTPQGTPVAKITIATNERFKDKSGEWQDRPEGRNVVLWQRLSEDVARYLKEGGRLCLPGPLRD